MLSASAHHLPMGPSTGVYHKRATLHQKSLWRGVIFNINTLWYHPPPSPQNVSYFHLKLFQEHYENLP